MERQVHFQFPESSFEQIPTEPILSIYGSSFPPASSQLPHSPSPLNSRKLQPKLKNIQRTTKNTQKLVLFPESSPLEIILPETISGFDVSDVFIPENLPDAKMTEAERLSKDQRFDVPRVSSYCLAESFKMDLVNKFMRDQHSVFTQTFDECLYASYEPHVKNILFGTYLENGKKLKFTGNTSCPKIKGESLQNIPEETSSLNNDVPSFLSHSQSHGVAELEEEYPSWMRRGEVFIFDYGVVVLWNFTKIEESKFLSIIKQCAFGKMAVDDIILEDLHYQYDLSSDNRPRMYSDLITLKGQSSMIKLTISHALAQSCKLALFENVMDKTIGSTSELPRMMAKYGHVRMKRFDVMKIVGKLFKLKMNVNLISNVLDTPEIFDTERELRTLYVAIRGYMEISQRVIVLNSRSDVVSDLLRMLSDHLNSNEMTYITWIVILLILFAVVIAGLEVYVKYLRLQAGMDD